MDRMYHKEPFVEGNYLYANGHGLTIEAVDDTTNKAIYYLSGQKKELTFGVDGVIIGGAKNDNCYSSSIIMNSGNVGIIHGGSFGNGDVAHANIIINGLWTDLRFTSQENQDKIWLPLNSITENIWYTNDESKNMRVLVGAFTDHPLSWKVSKVENAQPIGIQKLCIYQDFFDRYRDYIEKDENGNIIGMWANYYDSDMTPEEPVESRPESKDHTYHAEITASRI